MADPVAGDGGSLAVSGAFFALIMYFVIGRKLDTFWFWLGGAAAVLGILAFAVALARRSGEEIRQWMLQQLSLVAAVLIGLGLPGLAIWFGTSLSATHDSGGFAALVQPDTARLTLGRVLQWVFLGAASLFPALLYFLFDRERLRTLRDRFVRQVFRLVPDLKTLSDVEARYGARIEDAYGRDRRGEGARPAGGRSGATRLIGGRRSPVVLATVLLTVGWTFTMLNPGVASGGDFRLVTTT